MHVSVAEARFVLRTAAYVVLCLVGLPIICICLDYEPLQSSTVYATSAQPANLEWWEQAGQDLQGYLKHRAAIVRAVREATYGPSKIGKEWEPWFWPEDRPDIDGHGHHLGKGTVYTISHSYNRSRRARDDEMFVYITVYVPQAQAVERAEWKVPQEAQILYSRWNAGPGSQDRFRMGFASEGFARMEPITDGQVRVHFDTTVLLYRAHGEKDQEMHLRRTYTCTPVQAVEYRQNRWSIVWPLPPVPRFE